MFLCRVLPELLTTIQWDESALNEQRVVWMYKNLPPDDGVLVIGDTWFPKKGSNSVGVARQKPSVRDRACNCQVVITAIYAGGEVSWPLAARLYFPEEWTNNAYRRERAGVPEDVTFKTRVEIALELIDEAQRLGVLGNAVVVDENYGGDLTFLAGLEQRGLNYVAAIPHDFHVEMEPKEGSRTCPVKDAFSLFSLSSSDWATITWREGDRWGCSWRTGRFYAFQARRPGKVPEPQTSGVVVERFPAARDMGHKYYFTNLPMEDLSSRWANHAHRLGAAEKFGEVSRKKLGWNHYQGRLWTGFCRHTVLVMLAYSYLQEQNWCQWRDAKRRNLRW